MLADPITHASPIYQAAIRLPYKSGPAFQVMARRSVRWASVGAFLAAAGFWLGLAMFAGLLLSIRS